MSGLPTEQQQQTGEQVPEEEFISTNEVEQEIIADDAEDVPMDEDNDSDDEELPIEDEPIEIDMSNNSIGYFDKHTDSVFTVFHHPTLPLVCTGGGDNVANLWTSHSQPPKFAGSLKHSESVIGGGFTPDGQFLVTGDMNGKVLVHKSGKGGATWKPCAELQEVEEIMWIKVHPTVSGLFAFGATDGSVWCYQITPKTGQLEQIMSGFVHQQECSMGEFVGVEDGESNVTLVTCSVDSTIIAWNCFTAQPIFKITQSEIKGIEAPWISLSKCPASMSKGTPVIACGSNNGVLAIVNCNNGAVLQLTTVMELKPDQEELDASIESIAWSTKLPLMAIGLVCGEILLYDTLSWRVRHKITLEDSVTKLYFDEVQGFNLFASCINGKVYEYDARTGNEVFVCLGHNMGVLDFIVTEKGKKLITAGDEGVSLIFQLP
ncbi:LAFE_0D06106g1_1 [Lachancea fermentati]|uniref:LAFE_0D06106g1_1 n=1 Tax=Lachancea fermentati TaxID=4955 RepID=A0A1G4MBU2_LACFM|nr:LAFE_0D06106g1_1 [Lachancea fermentati]